VFPYTTELPPPPYLAGAYVALDCFPTDLARLHLAGIADAREADVADYETDLEAENRRPSASD
jgi:hypothetical protein